MIDYLASRADMVVRFQGGDNAGHTVVNDLGRFALQLPDVTSCRQQHGQTCSASR